MDKEVLEAMQALFVSFSVNFVKVFKGSDLDKKLKETDKMKIFKIISQSIEQTVKEMFDKCNEEKIEGDRKDA